MKQSLALSIIFFWTFVINAQTYNPYVDLGDINPKPLLPAEFGGTGTISFIVGNSGTDTLFLVPNQEMTLVVSLLNGVPDNAVPLNALGGTWATYFNWTYDPVFKSYRGTQNIDIPSNQSGTITIQYEVTANTTQAVSGNGFNVNLQPPPYANGSNLTSDDDTNGYTYVRATDFGDAPLTYGSAGADINLFKNLTGNYLNFVMLGDTIDHDDAYLVSPLGDGDDNDNLNDEDGVTFPTLIQGTTVTIPVVTTVRGGSAHFLNAWIDWNNNGVFDGTSEQIASNVAVFTTQTTQLTVNIPANAVSGATFARFRFGSMSNSTGMATYGEVEDYQVNIIASQPSIALVKTGTYQDLAPLGTYNAGDEITYTFTVTNTGNVPLTNVTVTDPLVTVSGTPIATLNPGESDNSTFTAVYTLTQADIDAGTFTNTATATGTFDGSPVTDTDDDVQNFTQTPAITIVKTAAPTTYNALNQTITYSFLVTNTGNVTLTNVNVTDPLVGLSAITPAPVTLAPGASQVFTATYDITQADLNAGSLSNTATATGTDTNNNPVTDTDTETIDAVQTAQITLLKDGTWNDTNMDGFAQAGETITYTFNVQNSGNVTVTNIDINDAVIGVTDLLVTPSTLAPGQTGTATFTYTVLQSDIDAGGKYNIATATGQDPNGDDVTDLSDDPTPLDPTDPRVDPNCLTCTYTGLPQNPVIQIVKTSTTVPNLYNYVGDILTYDLTVTNNGNVTLTDVVVSDPVAVVTGSPIVTLAPGQIVVLTATYTVQQADLVNGQFVNVATATGNYTDEVGDPQTVSDDDDETIQGFVPDVTPVVTAFPNVMQGVTDFNLTVRVTELNSVTTNGVITVKIPKDVRLSLPNPYDPSLVQLGPIALNNNDWAYSEDTNFHILTSNTPIISGGFSIFGFVARFDPSNAKGLYTLTSQIDAGSGGEIRIDNNVDSEKLDYFIE